MVTTGQIGEFSDAMQGSSDDLSLNCQKIYNNQSFPLVMMMQVQ